MVLAMTAVVAGCGSDSGDDGDGDAATPTTVAATTVPVPSTAGGTTIPSTSLTLRITDVGLVNSEESDNGMRVLLPAGVTTAAVTVTGLPSPNRVISVCQAQELDRRFSGAACRTPANGEAVNVALGTAASGVEIIQVGVTGAGAAGNTAKLDEVTIRYTASSREVNVRLPQVASGETGGRPTFGLSPASSDGSYRATMTWTVIPVFGGTPANGQIELLEGSTVSGQAQSGSAQVQLNGKVATPGGNATIRVQNLGTAALVTPKLNMVLP
jgi:hypothetical protein